MAQHRTIFQRIYQIAGIELPDNAEHGPSVEYYGSGHGHYTVLVAMKSPDLITVTNLRPEKHARLDTFTLKLDASAPNRPMLRAAWSASSVEVGVICRPAATSRALDILRQHIITLNGGIRYYPKMYPTMYLNLLDDAANLNRNPKHFYKYRVID